MPMLSFASPSVASVGAKAEISRRSAVPRSVRSSACLSGGAMRAVPVSVSGLPPALNGHVARGHQTVAISSTDGRSCGHAHAGEREVGLVERQRAGHAVERRAGDAQIERRRHRPSMLASALALSHGASAFSRQADDAQLGEAGLNRPQRVRRRRA